MVPLGCLKIAAPMIGSLRHNKLHSAHSLVTAGTKKGATLRHCPTVMPMLLLEETFVAAGDVWRPPSPRNSDPESSRRLHNRQHNRASCSPRLTQQTDGLGSQLRARSLAGGARYIGPRHIQFSARTVEIRPRVTPSGVASERENFASKRAGARGVVRWGCQVAVRLIRGRAIVLSHRRGLVRSVVSAKKAQNVVR
jgi:hypothetical protein